MKYNVNGRPIPSCDLHRDQYRAVLPKYINKMAGFVPVFIAKLLESD